MARRLRTKKQNRADLREARKLRRVVRVRRVFGEASDIDALVLELSKRWVVLAPVLDDGTFNGYVTIRLETVECVDPDPSERFHRLAIALAGGSPPRKVAKRLDLGRTRDLIASAAEEGTIVSLHLEHDWPDECYIGVPAGFRKNEVKLIEVSPQARWDSAPTRWRLGHVTRVDFGGSYERTLQKVAGLPPGR